MLSSSSRFSGTSMRKDTDSLENNQEINGLVTAAVCKDYFIAGGIIPGLVYVGIALACQAVRVYTDLWLSKWTEDGSRPNETSSRHEEVIEKKKEKEERNLLTAYNNLLLYLA